MITLKQENMKPTPAMKAFLELHSNQIQELLPNAKINCLVKTRSNGRQKIELTVRDGKKVYRKELEGEDYYSTVLKVCKIVERQIRKYLDKQHRVKSHDTIRKREAVEEELIVRHKTLTLEEETVLEALQNIKDVDHDFYAFKENGVYSILYKRFDGSFGVLQLK